MSEDQHRAHSYLRPFSAYRPHAGNASLGHAFFDQFQFLRRQIEERIPFIMNDLYSPITTISRMDFHMAAMILAEVEDFIRFASPDKLLAYAGMSSSTHQFVQLKNCYPHMEKRSSRYLCYALYNATKCVCRWNPSFPPILPRNGWREKTIMSRFLATKKLVRLIFAMEKSRQPYSSLAE